MRPLRRALALVLLTALPLGGCETDDHVVLIEVYSQAPVAQLEMVVVSLDRYGPPFSPPAIRFDRPRQPTDLLSNPIRIAVRLPGPATAMVHMTARTGDGRRLVATRCYGVTGELVDSVVLTDLAGLDRDGDTWVSDPAAVCREPEPGDVNGRPCASTDLHLCPDDVAADCNDTPADLDADPPDWGGVGIHPAAHRGPNPMTGEVTPPYDAYQCQNQIDSDCDGDVDEACQDSDGDGVTACAPNQTTPCDCNDNDPSIHPNATDVCNNGIDEDCSGADACCDEDGDRFEQCIDPVTFRRTGDCIDAPVDCERQSPACEPCFGTDGECARTELTLDAPFLCLCPTRDPTRRLAIDPRTVNPGAPEVCFDGIDNNCNGLQNELGACLGPDFDGDGVAVCGQEEPGRPCEEPRYDCDSGLSPIGIERCLNGIDDDLDGMTDEGCPVGDMDGDRQVPPRDCDDGDPLAYTHDPGEWVMERCGDGVPQSCVPGTEVSAAECAGRGDTDGDGYLEPPGCEGNAMVHPDVPETCNGVDDNCDGVTDWVLDPLMTRGCGMEMLDDGMRRGVAITFATDFAHCGECRFNCGDTFGAAANVCVGGVCDCAEEPGEPGPCAFGETPTCCGDGCRDIGRDPLNCGGCGVRCGAGESCVAGRCACGGAVGSELGAEACPEPAGVGGLQANVCCDGACRDVTVDVGNCGGCNVQCGPNAICNDRICRCDPATPQFDDCNGDLGLSGDGCETNIQTSVPHCGRCGRRCSPANATGQCVGGTCLVETCATDWDDCDGLPGNGCEGNLRSLTHCNGCGMTCSLAGATATCMNRRCEIATCGANLADCNGNPADGCETPLGTVMNCASCGDRCNLPNATPRCNASGRCVIQTCNDGWADCNGNPADGCETNIDTNANCGACGNNCGSNATCTARACSCNAGRLDCAPGSPYCEVAFSTSNCGACSVSCGVNESCNPSGACACGTGATGSVGGGTACPGQRCCTGTCRTLGTTADCSDCGDACRTNETCFGTGPWNCRCGGAARCTGANSCCPGTGGCVNLNGNLMNCGMCGNACGSGETCTTGNCLCNGGPRCMGGNVCCGAAGCRNTLGTDTSHCGGCGVMCQASETCASGACRCGGVTGVVGTGRACAVGQTCCPGSGDCVNTQTDANNCGGCGISCGPGQTCSGGRCICNTTMGTVGGGTACPGTTCCPGVGCRNLTNDNNHCGMCGMMCADGATCSMSMCSCGGVACGGGQTCCGGDGCRNLNNDPAHCGGCGIACGSGGDGMPETCSTRQCRCGPASGGMGGGPACTGATPDCCGALGCQDVRGSDPAHCRGCGMPCGTNETCNAGTCQCNGGPACTGGNTCCGSMGCQDVGGSDPAHCRGCGMSCRMGETCDGGTCECNDGPACTGSDVCCPGVGCAASC
ncbi:MAG: hypothetical protein KF729_01180 [Sandaracinaceae bacterium]|nr:hypothetical protein [Sandaracinaceae bacterium]